MSKFLFYVFTIVLSSFCSISNCQQQICKTPTCICSDDHVRVNCTSASLPSMPHTLHPMIEELILRNNSIKQLGIYGELSIAPNLRILDLSYNKFERLSAEPFSHQTLLKSLNLDGNGLSGITKDFFKGLKSLEELRLSKNSLGPDLSDNYFQDLKQLKSLNLSYNNIASISRRTFSSLELLSALSLRDNDLGVEVDKNSLTRDINVNVTYDKLVTELKIDGLRPWILPNLEFLDLGRNMFTIIRKDKSPFSLSHRSTPIRPAYQKQMAELSSEPTVESVESSNDISHHNYWPSLTELWMDDCGIEFIQENSFDALSSLSSLILRNNRLHVSPSSFVPTTTFGANGNLKMLDLSWNLDADYELSFDLSVLLTTPVSTIPAQTTEIEITSSSDSNNQQPLSNWVSKDSLIFIMVASFIMIAVIIVIVIIYLNTSSSSSTSSSSLGFFSSKEDSRNRPLPPLPVAFGTGSSSGSSMLTSSVMPTSIFKENLSGGKISFLGMKFRSPFSSRKREKMIRGKHLFDYNSARRKMPSQWSASTITDEQCPNFLKAPNTSTLKGNDFHGTNFQTLSYPSNPMMMSRTTDRKLGKNSNNLSINGTQVSSLSSHHLAPTLLTSNHGYNHVMSTSNFNGQQSSPLISDPLISTTNQHWNNGNLIGNNCLINNSLISHHDEDNYYHRPVYEYLDGPLVSGMNQSSNHGHSTGPFTIDVTNVPPSINNYFRPSTANGFTNY